MPLVLTYGNGNNLRIYGLGRTKCVHLLDINECKVDKEYSDNELTSWTMTHKK